MKTTSQLLNEAKAAVAKVNEAIKSDKFTDISGAKEAAKECVANYNKQAKTDAYDAFLKTEKPFLAAIKAQFIDVVRMAGTTDVVLDPVQHVIDLVDFEDYSKKILSHNAQWRHRVEKFNYVMSKETVTEMGSKADGERFAKTAKISKNALGVDDIKDITPTKADPYSLSSKTKMLQSLVDGIIFEDNGKGENSYKVTSRDVKYIDRLRETRNGTGGISCSNAKTMRSLLLFATHRIVTNGDYGVDFDAKKEKNTAKKKEELAA